MRTPLLAAFIGLCCACSTPKPEAEAIVEDAPSAPTRWVRAEPASSASWLEAPARVLAAPEASGVVSVPLTAHVLRVRVRPGQQVKAGDAVLDVLMPDLTRAAGALTAASLRLEAFEARRKRVAPLVDEGLARAAELAELDAAMAVARADRESARATLRAAGVSDAQGASLLAGSGTLPLRAPVAGMVTKVSAQVGEVREPNGGSLLEIAGSSGVQIEARFATVPPAGATFEWAGAEGSTPLTLDALSPRAGQDGARLGWLHAEDASAAPLAGALGRVRIRPASEWVVIPARALSRRDGGASVQTRTDAGTRPVAVQVVLATSSEAVVTGIAAGTLVAADAEHVLEKQP